MIKVILVMVVIGLSLGIILGLASIFFHVEEDHRIETVTGMLPGFNCGGCGFAGCGGFAQALVEKEVNSVSLCKPCKVERKEEIANYLADTKDADGNGITVTA